MMGKRKDKVSLTTNQLASNIRKAREYRNYTQEYLAFKLSISQNAYSKIELGHTKLTVDRLFQIAEVLEVDPVVMIKPGMILGTA